MRQRITTSWDSGDLDQPTAVIISEEAHYCLERTVNIIGWGDAGVIQAKADHSYRMRFASSSSHGEGSPKTRCPGNRNYWKCLSPLPRAALILSIRLPTFAKPRIFGSMSMPLTPGVSSFQKKHIPSSRKLSEQTPSSLISTRCFSVPAS